VTPKACRFTLSEVSGGAPSIAAFAAWQNTLAAMHLRQETTYQAASQFRPLQWTETGPYLAAGLGWVCVWQVRRRRVP
jgi:hypothetical protein